MSDIDRVFTCVCGKVVHYSQAARYEPCLSVTEYPADVLYCGDEVCLESIKQDEQAWWDFEGAALLADQQQREAENGA